MEKSGSSISEAVSRFRDRVERLKEWGISLTLPGAIREIERIAWEMGEECNMDFIKSTYLLGSEEDSDLINFVRQRLEGIEDPLTRAIEATEAVREYMHTNPDRLIDWVLHRIFADIS